MIAFVGTEKEGKEYDERGKDEVGDGEGGTSMVSHWDKGGRGRRNKWRRRSFCKITSQHNNIAALVIHFSRNSLDFFKIHVYTKILRTERERFPFGFRHAPKPSRFFR
jgi:hypothetical protein